MRQDCNIIQVVTFNCNSSGQWHSPNNAAAQTNERRSSCSTSLSLCILYAFHPSLIWRAETNAMETASSVVADGRHLLILSDLSGDLPASLSTMGSYYARPYKTHQIREDLHFYALYVGRAAAYYLSCGDHFIVDAHKTHKRERIFISTLSTLELIHFRCASKETTNNDGE